jgi:hypothetical protein
VPADAGAIIHVDGDAFRKASIFRSVRALPDLATLDAVTKPIVLSLLDSCQSVTVWLVDSERSGKKEDLRGAIIVEMPHGRSRSRRSQRRSRISVTGSTGTRTSRSP